MCGRINVYDHAGVRALLNELGVEHWPTFTPRFNIAPSSMLDVLTMEEDSLQHQKMSWGIIPKWARPGQFSSPLFNARAETIRTKPSFKNLVKNQRILVPVNGFYEWIREDRKKTPVYISPKAGNAMFLAGIYQHVSGSNSQCCLITTEANSDMQSIHHRMPVISSVEHALKWLGHSPEPELDKIMQPPENGQLQMQVVSDYVNNTRNDGPDCMRAVRDPMQHSLL